MYIYYKGIKQHFQVVGEGAPVLFLHGWGGCIDSFKPIFNAMSKTHQCILVDFIGFGESGISNIPYTLDDYVASVLEILKFLKISEVDIISHSFGGRVSLKLMAENEGLVQRAILVAPAGIKPKRKPEYYIKIAKYKFQKLLHKMHLIKDSFLEQSGSSDYRELNDTAKATFINIVNENLIGILPNITSEVLLIYGDGDTAVPLDMILKLKQGIVGSEYITLKGGHFCYLVEMATFVQIAQSFFKYEE